MIDQRRWEVDAMMLFFMMIGFFFQSSLFLAARAQERNEFRTPAKLYGSAYSIKVTLKRDGTEFVAPFWIKPDQAQSSLDLKMMSELGWYYPDTKTDEMKLADQVMPSPSFIKMKSAWAFSPQFPGTCCYGVLGQDFLARFKITFEPQIPTHVQWEVLGDDFSRGKARPVNHVLMHELSQLFNLSSNSIVFEKSRIDLSDDAYELNFSNQELRIKPAVLTEAQKKIRRTHAIFDFNIMPPIRLLKVTTIDPSVQKSAREVGLKIGSVIWAVRDESVIFLDQFFVQRALKGRVDAKLELLVSDSLKITKRKTLFFDFAKNEFLPEMPEKKENEIK